MSATRMTTGRDAFLQRVRQAVAEGNRAGAAPPLPQRGNVAYQGAGVDLLNRFCSELTAAGGNAHMVNDGNSAVECILGIVRAREAKHILVGRGPVLDGLLLPERLQASGLTIHVVDALAGNAARQVFFQADIGITGVAWAVAETGTLVMASRPADPRSLSLLPPVHIAVVSQTQLVPDLFDLFADLEPDKANLPSCLTLITGPSKTGDIESQLVTGVHGPGELHVVLTPEAMRHREERKLNRHA